MSKTRVDSAIVNIDNMLNTFSSASSKPSMFRVSDDLSRKNPEAYVPKIIAIGPFHHSNGKLQKMEQHKVRYLNLLLERRGESSVERYVATIRHLEAVARRCYAEDIQLDKEEFVQMLTLDGCFIIEFLHKFQHKKARDDDPIFQYEHIRRHLLHDLMVFENQIPFLIIETLFKMISNGDNINSLIWPLLQNSIYKVQVLPEDPGNAQHLLGIVHHFQCSSFAKILLPLMNSGNSDKDSGNSDEMMKINSAVELKEAGISFKRSKGSSFFHIELKNKAMIIPEWEVSDSTESLFRNLIAYEYYLPDTSQRYVSDYVYLMTFLVRSSEDAKLLRRSEIISNLLGSDEMVSDLISRLGKNIMLSAKSSYFNIFSQVKSHCEHPWNRWMANLRRKYFNSPWAIISVIAAATVLVLTVTQTVFAILSFSKFHLAMISRGWTDSKSKLCCQQCMVTQITIIFKDDPEHRIILNY